MCALKKQASSTKKTITSRDTERSEVRLSANPKMLNDFVQEGRDQLMHAELQLLALKKKGLDPEAIRAFKTSMDSIGKTAQFLFLKEIQNCAEETSILLEFFQHSRGPLEGETLEVLEQVIDVLRSLFTGVETALATDLKLRTWPQVPVLIESLRMVLLEKALEEKTPTVKSTVSTKPKRASLDIQVSSMRIQQAGRDLEGEVAGIISDLYELGEHQQAAAVCAERLALVSSALMDALRDQDLQPMHSLEEQIIEYALQVAESVGREVGCHFLNSEWKVDGRFHAELAEILRTLVQHAIQHGLDSKSARRAKPDEASLMIVPKLSDTGLLEVEVSIDGKGDDPRASKRCDCFQRARHLAAALHGELDVIAVPGSHTAFILTLPIEMETSCV